MKHTLFAIAVSVFLSMGTAQSASIQFYTIFDTLDVDEDGYFGGAVATATPTFSIPTDFDDDSLIVFPGAADVGSPGSGTPNGLDEDQDGVIDGDFESLGVFSFSAIGDLFVAPGDGFSMTLDISGINSPSSLHLQAYASGVVFDRVTRELSWTSSTDDEGSTFLFSIAAGGSNGPTSIQRQFNVTVIPEPSISSLFLVGCISVVIHRRSKPS